MRCVICMLSLIALCAAAAPAVVVEDFEAWTGGGSALADPSDSTNTVLALKPGEVVEIDLPGNVGVVTMDVYDFGESVSPTTSTAYGPRWAIEGADGSTPTSVGVSILYQSFLDGDQGYGMSSETSRTGSWFSPKYFGGPRACTLETWVNGVDQNNGVGRWTTWTFEARDDDTAEIRTTINGVERVKNQWSTGSPMVMKNMNKVWLSGGRPSAFPPVAAGPYAGCNVLIDNITFAGVGGQSGRPGDANLDGKVDIADFIVLKQNYGSSPAMWSQGDFTQDGKVDIADFIMLKQHYGETDFAVTPSYQDDFNPGWTTYNSQWWVATWMQNNTQMSRDRCDDDGQGYLVQTVLAGDPPSGGSMQSRIEFPYGRWVARIKPSSVYGVLNSMFTKDWEDMSTPEANDGTGFEVDIELLSHTYGTNSGLMHVAIHPPGQANFFVDDLQLGFNPSDDFHEFGFDILPDKVVWHVDGAPVCTWTRPEGMEIPTNYEMFFNSWTSVNWIKGPPAQDAYYHIDWVKFYPWNPY